MQPYAKSMLISGIIIWTTRPCAVNRNILINYQKSKLMLKKFDFETQNFFFFRQKEMAQTQCLSHFILAGVEGLEPSRTVLETGMLPLHHTPKERHIKFLLCSICNIGTRLWRPACYHYIIPLWLLPLYYMQKETKCQELFGWF